ncbi:hypothetical protein [Actinacidiphila oryziradicis]|uniref:hypothetical protein n=1 Tax=Actinacidiphila oryziradicis TaxID=2571141 RepID=UPI001FED19E2|nr:hypothetical protein [Actinacidiphila oryziradicis]
MSFTVLAALSVVEEDVVAPEVAEALGEAEADADAVELSPTPSRLLSASPTPSGSSALADLLAEADADAEGEGVAEEALGLGVLVPLLPLVSFLSVFFEADTEELADGLGVAVAVLPDLSLPPADGEADADAVSDAVAHDLPENGFFGSSSACASRGVMPMPISTAVGIAAMAIALPAGICNLVSSDFLGAACLGPVLAGGPPHSASAS